MQNTKPRYIYITGLTAIGKTKLSINLAKSLSPCEIVNSDSQQFYKEANTMTATATEQEMENIKHHLLSFLPLTTIDYNVNKFSEIAKGVLKELESEKKNIIIVGGTNYYTESLIYSREENEDIGENLGKRSFEEFKKSELEGILERKNFEEMINFYRKIEPEKAELVLENDTRKLENALKRVLMNENSGFTWKGTDHDFILLILDTNNIEWLEFRIKKRIKEMVCEEGGLEEIFRVLLKIAKFWAEEDGVKLETAIENLNEKTHKGVLQAIGYKEFIELFQIMFKESENIEEFEEELVLRAGKLIERYDEEGGLLKKCVDDLARDTIKLTKKQRKWIKNRILTNEFCVEKSFYFKVESKQQFFSEVFPNALEISKKFLEQEDVCYGELNEEFSGYKHKLMKKNLKINFYCDICDKKVIGEKEKKIHLKSRKHYKLKKKLDKKKMKNNVQGITKEEDK